MSLKTVVIALGILVVAGVGYYAISPLFRNIEVNEAPPVVGEESETVDTMDEKSMDKDAITSESSDTSSETTEPNEPPQDTVRGPFAVSGTVGHPASGSVRVFHTQSGTTIRYENFKTINGPNLHVYLATDKSADDFIDLGPIKGTEGNINYTVPADIDIDEYPYVMTWCVPFGVLFNYALIQ